MEVSALKYPNKSHRKVITIPPHSTQLAELLGIIFGDGGINNGWQLVISLNSVSDYKYSEYVSSLLQILFKINVAIRKRPNQKTLVLICSSTTLVDFLVKNGAVRGSKIFQQIDIPKWIEESSSYKKAFVRGMVDTDGCLFTHRHFIKSKLYINIGFCFTSNSKKLIFSVSDILNGFGIKSSMTDKNRRIYLYSEKSVKKYLDIFGSSNPRIYEKYTSWKEECDKMATMQGMVRCESGLFDTLGKRA